MIENTYKNPVIFGDYADPDIICHGSDFYMVSSSFLRVPGLPVLHSKDLVNWRLAGYALEKLPDGCKRSGGFLGGGVWAPSIRYYNGSFYIFFCNPDSGIYMTKSGCADRDWEEPRLIISGRGLIDPCPLWENGRLYIVHAYAKSRCGINSRLAVITLDENTYEIIDGDRVIFDGTISHPIIEGPKFYKRDGWYYIFSPAGGIENGWQTVLRSKSVYGPYEDRIVLRQGKTDINGPHQGGLVELDNGESWFMHFRQYGVYGRIIYLEPVQWLYGWPVMGEKADSGLCGQPVYEYFKPDTGEDGAEYRLGCSDKFENGIPAMQWQWYIEDGSSRCKPAEGFLRLESGGTQYLQEAALTQRLMSCDMTAEVYVEPSAGAEAGLMLFGNERYSIAVTEEGIFCVSGDKEYKAASGGRASLRVEIKADENKNALCRFSFRTGGEEYICLGDEFSARDAENGEGIRVGIYCIGEEGKFADFYDFTVKDLRGEYDKKI